jgi:hypothetical protein
MYKSCRKLHSFLCYRFTNRSYTKLQVKAITLACPIFTANEMPVWNWVLDRLGYTEAQDEQYVKLRTKVADDGWIHVSVPKPIPDFEDKWLPVCRQKSEAYRRGVNGGANIP